MILKFCFLQFQRNSDIKGKSVGTRLVFKTKLFAVQNGWVVNNSVQITKATASKESSNSYQNPQLKGHRDIFGIYAYYSSRDTYY